MRKLTVTILGFLFSLMLSAQINTDRVILIGRNALYFEDYILSIQYFNQAIGAKPYLPEPYFYRAIAKYFLDDTRGAEEDCSLALERNPFMIKAYQLRADARQAQGKYDEAITDYNRALEVYPNEKLLLINMGIVNIQRKDYAEAESTLDDLISKHPRYTHAYLTRGAMYQEKGDTIRALGDLDYAIQLDKFMPESYSMRGILYYQMRKYDDALSDLNQAIQLDPFQTGNYINRGLIRYAKNDIRGAMADYDKVVDTDKYNIIARFNRGLLRGQVGDYNRAVEDFNVVLSQEPDNYIAYVNRALTKYHIKDYKGALKDLDIVLDKYPDFTQGFYTRAQIKRELNDLAGAEKDLKHAKDEEKRLKKELAEGTLDEKGKTREKSDTSIDKFDLLVVADKSEEEKSKYNNKYRGRVQNRQISVDLKDRFVVSYYDKDSELNSGVYFSKLVDEVNKQKKLPRKLRLTNNNIALNQFQIEDHFKSIDDLSQQLGHNSNDALLYFARAIDNMLVQDFFMSIEDFKKAIAIQPDFVLAYFNLAVVYTKQLELKEGNKEETISAELPRNPGNIFDKNKTQVSVVTSPSLVLPENLEYEQIIRNYNTIIEIDPSFVYAYYNRAEIRFSRNDYRSAILDYNEVIRQNPNFAEAYYNRGLCRFHLRDKDRALEDMRKAGELGIVEAYSLIKRMTE